MWSPNPGTAEGGNARLPAGHEGVDMFLIWILAVIIAIAGVVSLIRGEILWGIGLLVLACIVGPGGYSIFDK